MACRGPQGISPFSRPMYRDEWLSLPINFDLSFTGSVGTTLRRPPMSRRFSAMSTMKIAAISWITAWAALLSLNTEPMAPTMPPTTV